LAVKLSEYTSGVPKERFVAYLGSIRDINNITARADFWVTVAASLDRINLTAANRMVIEARIADRVPRVTSADLAAATRHAATALQHLTTGIGGGAPLI
jgi:hypothetical protein